MLLCRYCQRGLCSHQLPKETRDLQVTMLSSMHEGCPFDTVPTVFIRMDNSIFSELKVGELKTLFQ